MTHSLQLWISWHCTGICLTAWTHCCLTPLATAMVHMFHHPIFIVSVLILLHVSLEPAKTLPSRLKSGCRLLLLNSIHINYFTLLHLWLHTDWSMLSTREWHSIIRVHSDGYKSGPQNVLNLTLMWQISQEHLSVLFWLFVYLFVCSFVHT